MVALLQPSFTSGEISPSLYARVDLARYQTGLRKLRNFFVRPHGGISNRAGTQFIAELTGPSVLIPFIFSTEQAYMLVFSEERIRVFADGAFVESSTSVAISDIDIDAVSPYTLTVTTSSPHGLAVDQSITIEGVVGTGSYDINGQRHVATVPSSTTFTIARLAIAPTGSYTSGGTVITNVELTTPYQEADLAQLRFAQSADVLTVVHPDYPPHEFRRLSATSFTFIEAEYETGPFLDLNTDTSIFVHASAKQGTVTLTATGDIFTSDHIGALFYLEQKDFSKIPPWEPNKLLAFDSGATPLGELRRSDGKTYKCVTGDVIVTGGDEIWTGTVRPVHDKGVEADGDGNKLDTPVIRAGVEWEYQDSGFGIVRITQVASGTSATAEVLRQLPDTVVGGATTAQGPWTMTGDGSDTTLSITGATSGSRHDYEVTFDGVVQEPTLYEVDFLTAVLTFYTAPATGVEVSARQLDENNRTDVWAFGAWSEDQGYPSLVTYFQDRLIYAASRERPQTVWGSKNGNYIDFGVSVPLVDDDAVDFTMNARQINAIRDLVPLDKLIALTSAGAWKVTDGQNEVLTPSTVGFKPQSYRGAKEQRSVIVGDVAIFVQDGGRKVRTLEYRLDTDKFSGSNLTIMSEHLLSRSKTVVDMDYADEPHAILWVVRSDGKLLSLTYDQEHEVIGWGRHDTAGGAFERVCSIPEDSENAVYFVVLREVNGQEVRYLERLADREIDDVRDAFIVDSGLSYDGRNEGATTITLTGSGWTVDDDLTLTASAATFESDDVGDEIWLHISTEETDEDGETVTSTETLRLEIRAYTSSTVVTVRPRKDVAEDFQATAFTEWTFARDTFSGLDHLEGETVSILADGSYVGQDVVDDGAVTLDSCGGVVHIGKPITADMELLDVNVIGQETVRDRAKTIPRVALIVQETRGLMAGPDVDNLQEFKERSDEDYDESTRLTSDAIEVYIPCSWGTNGRVHVRQDKPLPATILGAIPEVEFGGRG